jgi:GNAT superfamily N-acetyltransferase
MRPTRAAALEPPEHASADAVVRQATLADLDTVIDMRLELLREYADHPIYGRLRSDAHARAHEMYRAQLVARDQAIFLADRNARTIGILRCVDAAGSPLLDPVRYCYVSSAYVAPRARRHGVLHALFDAATSWARDRGLTEMRLHNATDAPDAIAAWDALGFSVVEQVRVRAL